MRKTRISPFVDSIETLTEINKDFRRVLFTGKLMQLVVMSLKPLEEIGLETHPHTDQFFRVEKGKAYFVIGQNEEMVGPGWAVIVPAGTPHNVINPSATKSLKLYTIYTPPQHPAGTVQSKKPKK